MTSDVDILKALWMDLGGWWASWEFMVNMWNRAISRLCSNCTAVVKNATPLQDSHNIKKQLRPLVSWCSEDVWLCPLQIIRILIFVKNWGSVYTHVRAHTQYVRVSREWVFPPTEHLNRSHGFPAFANTKPTDSLELLKILAANKDRVIMESA